MFLFVFQVDTGHLMKFNLSVAIESVANLQKLIETKYNIPVDKQVLITDGGYALEPESNVSSSYSVGTESAPIYLFNKSFLEKELPPTEEECDTSTDLLNKIQEYQDIPPSFEMITKRTQLAALILERGKQELQLADKLRMEQLFQQRGWSAVVANLADSFRLFQMQTEKSDKKLDEYVQNRESYIQFLNRIDEVLGTLDKIPLLESLLDKYLNLNEENEEAAATSTEENPEAEVQTGDMTLLQWISNKIPTHIPEMVEEIRKGLNYIDEDICNNLKKECHTLIVQASNEDMRTVKGIEKRLLGLMDVHEQMKLKVQEQEDLTQSFISQAERLDKYKDQSVVPNLCESHQSQLQIMAKNHNIIVDIRGRIKRAKDELCYSLISRLKWVLFLQKNMHLAIQRTHIIHTSITRSMHNVAGIQQIYFSPTYYLNAVSEVVRRRDFSQTFLLATTEMSCNLLAIYNDEIARRKEIQEQLQCHFLKQLFPGMEDVPPPFGTEPPKVFDANLPKITKEDLERLREMLPEFADLLKMPDISILNNLVPSKGLIKSDKDKPDDSTTQPKKQDVGCSNIERSLLNATSEPCLTTAHGLPHLKDLDRGCESETDTEEFEKVGQSPLDLHFDKDIPSPRPGTQDASTCTEDNLQISRSEHDKLKSLLAKLGTLAKEATVDIRSDLNELSKEVAVNKTSFEQDFTSLGKSWAQYVLERGNIDEENVMQIKRETEVSLQNLEAVHADKIKEIMEEHQKLIESLNVEAGELKAKVEELQHDKTRVLEEMELEIQKKREEHERELQEASEKLLSSMELQLKEKDAKHDQALKQLENDLHQRHKGELDSIRARFKLMTTERSSPSDSLSDQSLMQLTEQFAREKQNAIEEAVAEASAKWAQDLQRTIKELQNRMSVERVKEVQMNVVLRRAVEEERDQLKRKLEQLQEKQESVDVGTESSKDEGEASTSRSSTSTHQTSMTTSGCSEIAVMKGNTVLHVTSCKKGENVLVVWDETHKNYKIYQEGSFDYFLHPDSLPALNLNVVEDTPNKLFSYGEVESKEFCFARKPTNRYRVKQGSKFYRVKVKPISKAGTASQSLYCPRTQPVVQSQLMSQSQSVATVREEAIQTQPLDSPASSPIKETLEKIVDVVSEDPEELRPASVEKNFDIDSGIVDNVEQALVALDENIDSDERFRQDSENSDR